MTNNSTEQTIEKEIIKLKDQWVHWAERFSVDTLHQRDERIRSEVKAVLDQVEASDLGECRMFFVYYAFLPESKPLIEPI